MKNIKRFSIVIALIIVLSSMLCISVCAHEGHEEENPAAPTFDTVIDTQELVVTVPEMYQYYAISETDIYYMFAHGSTGDSIFVDVQANNTIPNGISALKEEEIKNTFVLYFLSEGVATDAMYYNMSYDEVKAEVINGVKMYKLKGTYVWDNGEIPAEELNTYGFCGYMTATKESIYFIASLYDVANTESVCADMDKIIATAYVNGTFFDGDKTTSKEDFSAKRPFLNAVQEDAVEYISALYGDDYYSEDLPVNEEELASYRKVVRIVCIVLIIVSAVPTIAVVVFAIVLIFKYRKNKKKLNELEASLTPQAPFYAPQPQATEGNAPIDTNNQ